MPVIQPPGDYSGLQLATSDIWWYVASTGSDSHPGTSAQPFGTIDHAKSVVASFNYQGLYSFQILVADGTYAEDITLPFVLNPAQSDVGDGQLAYGGKITGNTTTPTNVIVSGNPLGSGVPFNCGQPETPWFLEGLSFQTATTCNLIANNGGAIYLGDVDYGGTPSVSHNLVQNHGAIFGPGFDGYATTATISSTTFHAFFQSLGIGFMLFDNTTISFTNPCTVSFAFIVMLGYSVFGFNGGTFVNSNNLTGLKFLMGGWSEIDNANSTATDRSLLPGTVDGVLDWTCVISTDLIYRVDTPSTGNTVTMAPGQKSELLNPAATLAALTVQLPIAPSDGERAAISSTHIITALTLNSTDGSTVLAPPTTLAAGASCAMQYDANTTSWYPAA